MVPSIEERARALARAARVKGIQPAHALAVAIGILALLVGWFVGQAWVSAHATPATSQVAGDVSQSDAAASRQPEARLAPSAALTLSSDTVLQEGELTIGGGGFGPMETVVVQVNDPASGTERELASLSADWRGQVGDQSVTLPDWLTSGAQTLNARGERSGSWARATLYVRAKAHWMNLSTFGVKQADRLGFIAGGFEPGAKVNVYLAEGQDLQPDQSATPLLTVSADPAGNTAWTEMQVPLVKAGNYSLMLRGENEKDALSRNIVINALKPWTELSPWSGPPGSHINLNAREFVPGEDVGIFLGDSTDAALTVKADEYGNLWGAGPVQIPYEARGPFRVTLVGLSSHSLVTSSFSVTAPKPWVELSTYAGFAGTTVFFSGGGFAGGEQITIHVDSAIAPTISVGVANEQGYYRLIGPVNVPPDATEQVTFVLVGESSKAQGSATFKVLTPWVPAPAPPPRTP